jgi:hypothetical protein
MKSTIEQMIDLWKLRSGAPLGRSFKLHHVKGVTQGFESPGPEFIWEMYYAFDKRVAHREVQTALEDLYAKPKVSGNSSSQEE